ncbi:MAG: DUF1801 domain-containing protein [Patescibacteria group bacterium]
MKMKSYKTIDFYIANYPAKTQALLQQIRATIHRAAPKAEEAIKYGIPTFVLKGNLIHFGGYEYHIGLYPGSGAIAAFKKELSKYETSKGTVKFPLDKPIPFGLITKIVKFRVKQNTEK